jgi:aquaporin Z
MERVRTAAAEFLGTFVLVFLGCGAVITALIVGDSTTLDYTGLLGVALAFGLALYAGIHALGPISGAHFNPAVSIALALAGRVDWRRVPLYVGAQLLGALAASAAHLALVGGLDYGLGQTVVGEFGLPAALVSEFVLTLLLTLVILAATDRGREVKLAAFPIAFYLTAASLVGFPFSATSLNPARSLGPALFVGGAALEQMWLYTLAPSAGAVAAALIWRLLRSPAPKRRIAGIPEPPV